LFPAETGFGAKRMIGLEEEVVAVWERLRDST